MEKLAYVDKGQMGQPGSSYSKDVARVDRVRVGRYQLSVFVIWGSNQGYEEEHGRIERRYRADSVDELLRIGIAEIRADQEITDETEARIIAAIREACFEAEDAIAGK